LQSANWQVAGVKGELRSLEAPLAKIPVLQRGGSVVPRQMRPRRSSALMRDDPYTLVVALDAGKRAQGTLYLDDGGSLDFRRGGFRLRQFDYAPEGSAHVLRSSSAGGGKSFAPANTVERILVAGLNPHAGEGGHLGSEEIEVIAPALAQARSEGIAAEGPFPADTLFVEEMCGTADAVLAMYHDQGLPVLKRASFGRGVNITLGLPIIRTSVDHGTALAIAGTGTADAGSLVSAVEAAHRLAFAARKGATDRLSSAALATRVV
jgi:hypothetical protein